jgi:aryl-alcohol dehydrogenase-like predicted oxidoreductase
MEWSLQSRDLETAVVPTARELGVGIVPYSPLGRGLLSRAFVTKNDLAADDWRLSQPRFKGDALEQNVPNKFFELADKKGCTPAQLALAWVLSRGEDVVPIPGTKSASRLVENAGAVKVKLTSDECDEIAASIPPVTGDRYDDGMMTSTFNTRL